MFVFAISCLIPRRVIVISKKGKNCCLIDGRFVSQLTRSLKRFILRASVSHMKYFIRHITYNIKRALECGATSLAEPEDKPYDERSAGVRDTFGNTWWISTFKKRL
jgi:hypothetical protein